MAQRGGKRPGAGRKPGSLNKNSRAVTKAAAASGLLPHEWLLGVMRAENEIEDYVVSKSGAVVVDEDGKPLVVKRKPTMEERMDAAGKAAPFYAPKLQAIAAVPTDGPNPLGELMDFVRAASTNRARPGK